MLIACLDLESTLMPEVWIAVADHYKLDELRITTREEPDVEALMNYRLKILKRENITLADFQKIVRTLEPLGGAVKFYEWLKKQMPTVILTDALWPLIQPMIGKIGNPTVLSHDLTEDTDGFISEVNTRIDDQKTKTVLKLKKLNYETIAIGDSYNDLGMLRFADHGIIFNGSDEIIASMPEITACQSYTELQSHISSKILQGARS